MYYIPIYKASVKYCVESIKFTYVSVDELEFACGLNVGC